MSSAIKSGIELNSYDPFNAQRYAFLRSVAEAFVSGDDGKRNAVSTCVITHLLGDRPAFITALSEFVKVSALIAIPYSTNTAVLNWARSRYETYTPSLDELLDGSCLSSVLHSCSSPYVVMDMGGYAAPLLSNRRSDLIGVIEGTEGGVQRYQSLAGVPVPVVCMPGSPLKGIQAALIGPGCVFSIERLLRSAGFAHEPRDVTVLGYGRVGKGVASAFRARGFDVCVYDREPVKRLAALADGFLIPNRERAIARAEILVGASGQRSWSQDDAAGMLPGAFLVSCTSKDVEFGFDALSGMNETIEVAPGIHRIRVTGKPLHFLYNGRPINFRDGANVGPILTLLQAEMIGALADIMQNRFGSGICSPLESARTRIVDAFIREYIDESRGWYAWLAPGIG